jgi:hypothetical protein
MEAQEYHGDPAPSPSLNQGLVPTLVDRSPYHAAYAHPKLNPYGQALQSSLTQYFGEAVHRIALGRGRTISPIRYRDYRDESARRARDLAVANNQIPVLESELVRARDVATVLRGAIERACQGHPYETEVVLIWKERTLYGDIYCRAQVDVWCPALSLVLDPKALRIAATPDGFGRAAGDAGYDVQSVFYSRGFAQLLPEHKDKIRFVNLVVENYAPYAISAFEPGTNTRYVAERQVAKAMELWARCLRDREWPSYPETIEPYETPTFFQNRIINS